MRIHTTLTAEEIGGIVKIANLKVRAHNPNAWPLVASTLSSHRSYTRERGIELQLTGNSRTTKEGTSAKAASWDEWGLVLALIYDRDPSAVVTSVYDYQEDFNHKTGRRFDRLNIPADTHAQHHWEFTGVRGEFSCSACSAIRRA